MKTTPYTAIYTDSWMNGRHSVSVTKMRRIELREGETLSAVLEQEGIAQSTILLFHGHPLLQGEEGAIAEAVARAEQERLSAIYARGVAAERERCAKVCEAWSGTDTKQVAAYLRQGT